MPNYKLSNTSIATKLWTMLEDNSASYSTDKLSIVTVGKTASPNYFRIEPGVTNTTVGQYTPGACSGWRLNAPGTALTYTAGTWTVKAKLESMAKVSFTGKLMGRVYATKSSTGAICDSYNETAAASSVLTDDTYIYMSFATSIKKIRKSDMTVETSVTTSYALQSMVMDATYIYGYAGTYIYKHLRSDLSYVSMSATLGAINQIVIDDTHIYSSSDAGFTPIYAKKLLKTDLSLVTQVDYGDILNGIAVDDTYVYLVGNLNNVRRYNKSNMSYVSASPNYSASTFKAPYGVEIDSSYIYVCGPDVLVKYNRADLSLVTKSTDAYGINGEASIGSRMVADTNYIYLLQTHTVKKFKKSDMSYVQHFSALDITATFNGIAVDSNFLYVAQTYTSSKSYLRYRNSFICFEGDFATASLTIPATAGGVVTDTMSVTLPQVTLQADEYLFTDFQFKTSSAGSSSSAGFAFDVDENPTTGEECIITPATVSVTNINETAVTFTASAIGKIPTITAEAAATNASVTAPIMSAAVVAKAPTVTAAINNIVVLPTANVAINAPQVSAGINYAVNAPPVTNSVNITAPGVNTISNITINTPLLSNSIVAKAPTLDILTVITVQVNVIANSVLINTPVIAAATSASIQSTIITASTSMKAAGVSTSFNAAATMFKGIAAAKGPNIITTSNTLINPVTMTSSVVSKAVIVTVINNVQAVVFNSSVSAAAPAVTVVSNISVNTGKIENVINIAAPQISGGALIVMPLFDGSVTAGQPGISAGANVIIESICSMAAGGFNIPVLNIVYNLNEPIDVITASTEFKAPLIFEASYFQSLELEAVTDNNGACDVVINAGETFEMPIVKEVINYLTIDLILFFDLTITTTIKIEV